MPISVSWVNATRVSEERSSVEFHYRQRLVELCGSEEAALKYHDEHYRQNQRPGTEWHRLTAQASVDATRHLLPSERRIACFVVSWTPT